MVNSVGTKSHGICAGKSYGRASEAVMDKQNYGGKCAGKRPGKARELALAKPNTRTFSTANVFNAKDESWYTLVRFNVEKLNNENLYCIPPLHGVPAKKDLLLHQGSNLIGVFFHDLTCTMSGHLQKPLL